MLSTLSLLACLTLAFVEPPTSPPPDQAKPAVAAQKAKGAHDIDLPIPGVTNSGDATSSIVETVVDAPISRVWWVFSTPEGFKMLGSAHCEMDLRRGGLIRSHYDPKGAIGDPGTIENMILDLDPERMISWRIHKPPAGFPFTNAWKTTWAVATLTPEGPDRTRLRLAMLGYTPDEESQKMKTFFDKGNAWTLDKMKQRLAKPEGSSPASSTHTSAAIQSSLFVASGEKLDSFQREVTVNASPAEAFRAWTTSEGVKSFLGIDSNIDLAIGGPFEFYFGKDNPVGQRGSDGCQILAYVPDRMLTYSWNAPPKFPTERERRTWVVIFFSPVEGGKTRVEMVHSGFGTGGQWPDVRLYFEKAWPNVLKALQDHFAGSSPSAGAK